MRTVVLAMACAVLGAGAAHAQSAGEAGASLEIHRGLNVSTVRPMRVQLEAEGAALGISALELSDGPALVEVTGDANRVYRIQVMDIDTDRVPLNIWSANAGDISQSGVAVMDAEGHDLLRIAGDPAAIRRYFSAAGQIPLNIQYE